MAVAYLGLQLTILQVRIRSEHAIGFLKGRFQSLKGLRISIVDEASHKFATYWVVACVAVHSFAMQCEDEERDSDLSDSDNSFIAAGLSSSSSNDDNDNITYHAGLSSTQRVRAGKARREQLKAALFRHKAHRRRQRAEAQV